MLSLRGVEEWGGGVTVKREMRGGVSIFLTVSIGKKQMLSIKNRLPSLSNEEFKGWLVGSKMGTDGQHARSKCPYVMSYKRASQRKIDMIKCKEMLLVINMS